MLLLAPVVLFSGSLLIRLSASGRDLFQEHMLETARRSALALDRDVGSFEIALNTLATSGTLDNNLKAFHARAVDVTRLLGTSIVLRRPDSQQEVNSVVPWGQALPRGRDLETDARVRATQKPAVSNLMRGQVTGHMLVNVTVPVIRQNQITHLLSLSVFPSRFADLVAAQELPDGWVLSIVDRADRVVVSSPAALGAVGDLAPAEFRRKATTHATHWVSTALDRTPVFVAYARSNVTGFGLVVTAPQAGEAALMRHSLRLLLLFGIAAMVMSVVVGVRLGWFVSNPLRQLAEAGRRLGREQAIPVVRTPIREIRLLAEVLRVASVDLRARAQERDLVEGQLRELAATLETRVVRRTAELSAVNLALTKEIASREAAETQVRQLQKMEAIGQLTGGIAHDFNNMLAVVMSSLSLVQRRLLKGDTRVEDLVGAAMDGAERAANLTRRLLAFSRQQALAPVPTDVNALVAGMSDLLHRTLGETVRIETALAAEACWVRVDPGQLENALLNLAVNARDAMDQGGRLLIETKRRLRSPTDGTTSELPDGDYACIAVTDNGRGMAPDVLAKAFDPFFTTKEPGKGTGLGLSQVYGFVHQSGGHIRIDSVPNEGTTVRIFLPRHKSGPTQNDARSNRMQIPTSRRGETILVVEDEDRVRDLSTSALRELGYTVLEARSGADALQLLNAHPDISLLFTDIVMPEMDGRELTRHALQRRPSLPVLYTTGFTRDELSDPSDTEHPVNLLTKPYRLDQLAAKIRAILDAEAVAGSIP